MTVLALHPGLARDLFNAALFTWVAAEAVLRLRSIGGKTAGGRGHRPEPERGLQCVRRLRPAIGEPERCSVGQSAAGDQHGAAQVSVRRQGVEVGGYFLLLRE